MPTVWDQHFSGSGKRFRQLLSDRLLISCLRGRMATQRSEKGSEKVVGRVLGKGSEKGSQKGF